MKTNFGAIDPRALVASVGVLKLPSITTLKEHDSVLKALKVLGENDFGVLPIVSEEQELLGIISERDLVRHMPSDPAACADFFAGTALQYSSRNVQVIRPTDSLAYGIQLMDYGKFRHLPVVSNDGGGKEIPISMLSVTDIVHFLVETFEQSLVCVL